MINIRNNSRRIFIYKIISYLSIFLLVLPVILADSPLPNWYKGDQHVHSDYSNNLIDFEKHSNPLSSITEQTSIAKNLTYNWIIFTEHSFADNVDTASKWN